MFFSLISFFLSLFFYLSAIFSVDLLQLGWMLHLIVVGPNQKKLLSKNLFFLKPLFIWKSLNCFGFCSAVLNPVSHTPPSHLSSKEKSFLYRPSYLMWSKKYCRLVGHCGWAVLFVKYYTATIISSLMSCFFKILLIIICLAVSSGVSSLARDIPFESRLVFTLGYKLLVRMSCPETAPRLIDICIKPRCTILEIVLVRSCFSSVRDLKKETNV